MTSEPMSPNVPRGHVPRMSPEAEGPSFRGSPNIPRGAPDMPRPGSPDPIYGSGDRGTPEASPSDGHEKQLETSRQQVTPQWLAAHVDEVQGWGPVAGIDSDCWVDGCARSPHLHGLCRRHYFRAARRWKRPADEATTADPGVTPTTRATLPAQATKEKN